MQDKKVKLIYFSLRESQAKELELTWVKFYSAIVTLFFVMFFVIAGSIALFTDFYQSLENSSLAKLNQHLSTQIHVMGSKITEFEKQVHQLEQNDDDLRVIADLPKIDSDYRTVGIGGSGLKSADFDMALVSNEAAYQIDEYSDDLETMERRVELMLNSQKEIKNKLDYDKDMLNHTPSIRPVIDGTIRDKFGNRLHPILHKIRHHNGVDFAAERGTEVYSTAAGVVKKIVLNNIHKGFGKYVVIDHGFGIVTLYGHLSKILVRQGQKVDRWKPIGLVGSTGLSTGPHLHYELHKNGKSIDPMIYVLN